MRGRIVGLEAIAECLIDETRRRRLETLRGILSEMESGCWKSLFQEIGENNFASRFNLSDVLEFQDILHPPNFGLFGAEREFFNSHEIFHQ